MQAWLEMGGVFAVANLRGGGEYGEAWHTAGTRATSRTCSTTSSPPREFLIDEHYTEQRASHPRRQQRRPAGRRVLTQRPDLFGAALPAVGVMDMLRYHIASGKARSGRSTMDCRRMRMNSRRSTHTHRCTNVQNGRCYPPTLITTADHDNRVVPWHSYKFAAALQAAQDCGKPDPHARRDPRRPRRRQARVDADRGCADQWAFLASSLGVSAPAP